jgi:Uma2 family endonuclease
MQMAAATAFKQEVYAPQAERSIAEFDVEQRVDDDSEFYEVVRGVRVEHPPMGAKECVLANELKDLCTESGLVRPRGRTVVETSMILQRHPRTMRRPDFAFVSFDRWPANCPINEGEGWEVVPDWAVEIVSPSNLASAPFDKMHEYFKAGVRLVWIVFPNSAEVYVYRSPSDVRVVNRGEELDAGDVIPGLRIPMSLLFSEDPAVSTSGAESTSRGG